MLAECGGNTEWVTEEGNYKYQLSDSQTSSATNQAQIQGFELTHPNIYAISELPENERAGEVRISGFVGDSNVSCDVFLKAVL